MSRILDALRKSNASAAAPGPAPAPENVPVPPTFTRGAASGRPEVATGREGYGDYPLAESVDLPDDVFQQMTTLRVGLEAALGERPTRVVLFQSAQSGEGTTTIAHQFAWALARDRMIHALLVDLRAEHPSIEVDPGRRVATVSVGVAAHEPEVALNLRAVPVPEEFRRTGIYAAHAARELIESRVGSCDWIILDGPPVLEAPDAAPLAAIADGTVIVIHSGRTKRPVLNRAVELSRKAGARILGSVLNRRKHEIPEFIYRRL